MKPRVGLLVAVLCLGALPAQAQQSFHVEGWVGGEMSVGSADAAIEPYAEVIVEAPTAKSAAAPMMMVDGRFGGLPGETVTLTDLTSFKSVSLDIKLVQPLFRDSLYFMPYFEAGVSTRRSGDQEPSDAMCWHFFGGLRFARSSRRGWLEVGGGTDQRLTGYYQPAASITGALRLWGQKTTDKLKGTKMVLKVTVLAGLWNQPEVKNKNMVLTALAAGF